MGFGFASRVDGIPAESVQILDGEASHPRFVKATPARPTPALLHPPPRVLAHGRDDRSRFPKNANLDS
jgi:hypothetical protein